MWKVYKYTPLKINMLNLKFTHLHWKIILENLRCSGPCQLSKVQSALWMFTTGLFVSTKVWGTTVILGVLGGRSICCINFLERLSNICGHILYPPGNYPSPWNYGLFVYIRMVCHMLSHKPLLFRFELLHDQPFRHYISEHPPLSKRNVIICVPSWKIPEVN